MYAKGIEKGMRSQPRAQLGERLVKDIKVLGPIQSFGSFAIYLRTLLLKKRRGKRMKHTCNEETWGLDKLWDRNVTVLQYIPVNTRLENKPGRRPGQVKGRR